MVFDLFIKNGIDLSFIFYICPFASYRPKDKIIIGLLVSAVTLKA